MQCRSFWRSLTPCMWGWQRQPLFRFGVSPNKLMDYMMAGKPVIFAIDAGNDMVADASCGISIEPENSAAIAKAAIQLGGDAAGPAPEDGGAGQGVHFGTPRIRCFGKTIFGRLLFAKEGEVSFIRSRQGFQAFCLLFCPCRHLYRERYGGLGTTGRNRKKIVKILERPFTNGNPCAMIIFSNRNCYQLLICYILAQKEGADASMEKRQNFSRKREAILMTSQRQNSSHSGMGLSAIETPVSRLESGNGLSQHCAVQKRWDDQ